MSMASEVMKLIFAVLDMSFNSGNYTVITKRQLFYINYYNRCSAYSVFNDWCKYRPAIISQSAVDCLQRLVSEVTSCALSCQRTLLPLCIAGSGDETSGIMNCA